jgi:hypothetical protein
MRRVGCGVNVDGGGLPAGLFGEGRSVVHGVRDLRRRKPDAAE